VKGDQPTTKLDVGLRAIRVLTLAGVIGASVEAPAVDLNQHGLTGGWYAPWPFNNPQGVMLEVYPDAIAPGIGFLQGSWLDFYWGPPWDYDVTIPVAWPWYTFSGSISAGQSSATFVLYRNVGGSFNAPPPTLGTPIGTVVLSVEDCTTATMEVSTIDIPPPLTFDTKIPLVRLMPNVTCSTDGESMANADFGYSGHWFNPATSGQGFVFELNPNARVGFFAWYTYVPGGGSRDVWGQRWYIGAATYVPGSRMLPITLYGTNVFDRGKGAESTAVGNAMVIFSSCESAELSFTFSMGVNATQSGTINLSRVGPTPADCRP
jgi:hypothetical protein